VTPPPSQHRILILRHSLGLGGVETRLATLAEAIDSAGGRATVLAGPGPLAERMAGCADLRLVDFGALTDVRLKRLVHETAADHTCAVLACEPRLLRAVPVLATRVPVLLGLHGRGERDRLAFGLAGGRRMPVALRALRASGRVALASSSSLQAREHARLLDMPDDAVAVSPNGVPVPAGPSEISHGPVRSVALVCRLAHDKLLNVAAAIELVAAGRAAGCEVILDVYGSGSARPLVLAMLRRRLPRGSWRMHGPTMSTGQAFAAADAVVGTGRTSVEALMTGARVVPAKTIRDGRGQLGPVITPATFDDAASENFGWRTRPPVPAATVWAQLQAVPAQQIAAVCARARDELTPQSMLARELDILGELGPVTPRATASLAAADQLLTARLAGARRLPTPLDLPDRALLKLRRPGGSRW
jgi:hypothetical protein